tara:strand:+ start:1126 stop:1413 length:288 start_codon:yes stop_codon:yes gene_type:complete
MNNNLVNVLHSNWKLILIIAILGIFILCKSSEGFPGYGYGWIPIPTRNTYNMSYDIRGQPKLTILNYPYRTREWLGPFYYGLFPKWFISSRHPLA